MAITDVDIPESDGWWMVYLWQQLKAKQRRLKLLDDYRRGRPPLVLGSESVRQAFYKFQRVARSNFADVICQALVERMAVRSIRTASANNDNGDQVAWSIWMANNLEIDQADVHLFMASLGEGYVAIGEGEKDGDFPIITAEDPRQTITVSDPVNPRKTLAAFKLFHDDQQQRDYAYLWLPGRKVVAWRPRKARQPVAAPRGNLLLEGPPPPTPVTFSPAAFTVDEEQSETYDLQEVPVVRFANRDGVGEFELHTDLLDRINHMLLQRIVIATLQAFRQRAILLDPSQGADGDLPTHDDAGKEIDYDDLFSADPGALWKLPLGAKIWESAQADLSGILNSVKDDVLHLAVVTRTPFSMFTPDAANQSAEGAQLQREGLVFKVEDRDRIAGRSWAQVMSIALQLFAQADRSKLDQILVDWVPAERFSLAEKAQADSQAASLPVAQKLRVIWQFTPQEVATALAQRAADQLVAAATATQSPAPGSGGAEGS